MKKFSEKIVNKVLFRISEILGHPWWFIELQVNILYLLFGFENWKSWWCIRKTMYGEHTPEKATQIINEGRKIFPNVTNGRDLIMLSSLTYLFKKTDFSFSKVTSIFEMGGGYGGLMKAIRDAGYSGRYFIKDLSIFEKLQDYFIGYSLEHVILENPGLFIAQRSLSETSIETRKKFEHSIRNAKYVLISYFLKYENYQKDFVGENNFDYFKKLSEQISNKEWINFSEPNNKNSWCLIGYPKP